MILDEQFMQRCLQLAQNGFGKVAPNPMVGAILVYDGKIIGEGWHKEFGSAHAEVNCINSVAEENKKLISLSTLYVSLEPCSHQGKTPPCTNLIIENNIPKVVIATRDPFAEVNGKGIEILKQNGIEVVENILEKEAISLNKRFFTFHQKKRPYIVLKWAQSADGFMGEHQKFVKISHPLADSMVHEWRSQEAGIMIGTQAGIVDNPLLTVRHVKGKNPIRIVIDTQLKIPTSHQIFNDEAPTVILNQIKNERNENVQYIIPENFSWMRLLETLHQLNIQSILVEGGKFTLEKILKEGVWDELRVITNNDLVLETGIPTPAIGQSRRLISQQIQNDSIDFFVHSQYPF